MSLICKRPITKKLKTFNINKYFLKLIVSYLRENEFILILQMPTPIAAPNEINANNGPKTLPCRIYLPN
jgi:hypothetical protein